MHMKVIYVGLSSSSNNCPRDSRVTRVRLLPAHKHFLQLEVCRVCSTLVTEKAVENLCCVELSPLCAQ